MTIDTQRLRELAQNSTPGPWMRVFSDSKAVKKFKTRSGRDVTWTSDCFCPANGFSERVAAGHIDERGYVHFADIEPDHWRAGADAGFIAAANPATVLALLDELDRLRNVESAALQGEKIGCRCTYADNQTVDTECLYHRAIRSERDRLRSELTAMRENLNDARSELEQASAELNDAAQCIARQSQTISRLQDIEAAASNLAKVKGRHNSEIAMNQLLEALK